MTSRSSAVRSHLTLVLCTLLHAFTHAYGVALVPLYLMMRNDLALPGVERVALIVTLYGVVYFLLSYPAGMLADRWNRKALLGLGLVGNGTAILLMALTHQYWLLLLLGALAGVFGTLFHPAANALLPAHYPKSPAMSLGLMGIGSGIGFFVGPRYAGWRAQTAADPWLGMSNWQVPCLEMGLAGVIVGLLFLLLAREVAHHAAQRRAAVPLGPGLRRRVLGIALVIGCRDFAGGATLSLLSIYLQRAHHYDAQQTGWLLGVIGLLSILVTPLGVWLTAGKRRLPGLAITVACAGFALSLVPHVPIHRLLPVLIVFQMLVLASFSMSEVAIVERSAPAIRGRVVGLYLTIAGTLGAVSPWVIGFWTDRLGARADRPEGYVVPFATLGGMMILAAGSVKLIGRLGRVEQRAEVLVEAV